MEVHIFRGVRYYHTIEWLLLHLNNDYVKNSEPFFTFLSVGVMKNSPFLNCPSPGLLPLGPRMPKKPCIRCRNVSLGARDMVAAVPSTTVGKIWYCILSIDLSSECNSNQWSRQYRMGKYITNQSTSLSNFPLVFSSFVIILFIAA